MRGTPLALALVLAFALTPALAAATHPVVIQPPQPGSVWTVFTTVQANVRDNYATVKIIEEIANRGPDPEFPFVVRIPDDAYVTGLTIERDGTVYEAEIKDRETARQEYEDWKAQQQTGGLVEKTRRTSVYSYLVNVAEFTNVRATLTYERYLAADRGIYNLSLEAPVSGFGRDLGARFEVTVKDSDGVTALWGEPTGQVAGSTVTYEVGPRHNVEATTPFTARYSLSSTADAGTLLTSVLDGQGYFVHRFRAPEQAQQLPLDLVLVLDVSGSMSGLKLTQMVDSAKQVVQSLDGDDRLHLVAFSSDSRSAWDGMLAMTPENRRKAASEIDALFDGGGTNIEAGLRRGFTALAPLDWAREEERFPALVLLTDGQPTSGVTSHDGLRDLAEKANAHDVPVFGIAFGDDADWTLIRHLAEDGEGAAIRVPLGQGAEVDLRRFMAMLTTPVLRDVRVTYNDGVVPYWNGAPVLFAGSELLIVGTYDRAKGIRGTVSGWTPEGERRYDFEGAAASTSLSFLPRLAAYQQIRALEQDDSPDITKIKALALDFGFVTDHTSLVLTVPAAREFTATDERGDAMLMDQSASTPQATGAWTGAPAPTAPMPTGTWQAHTRSSTNEAMKDADHQAMTPMTGAPPPASAQPAVPGPGAALVVLAVASVALLLRARRR